MLLSKYAQKLLASARSRYEEKVLMCGSEDPLSLSVDETVTDTSAYPKVEECYVKDYLVGKASFITREQFKAHKSLESHNYLTSGWVQEPRLKVLPNNDVVVISKVRDFQSNHNEFACSGLFVKICQAFTGGCRVTWAFRKTRAVAAAAAQRWLVLCT